jgi:ornithine cyclodeaminase/alanine dehydrogenase-like protein (mu-crystallin family)
VGGASLIVSAARSRDETPVLDADWLEPEATVISIGSTLPEQREVDVNTIARAGLVVADLVDEVCEDTGDFIAARRAGVEVGDRMCPLSDLVSARRTRVPGAIALYKSVGSGLQDIATAELAFLEARKRGLAVPLPMQLSMKRNPRKK